MKLGILSDSHDNVPAVKAAAKVFSAAGVEAILHAGDFIAPFSIVPLADCGVPVYAVFGNNDGERVGLSAKFTANGWTVAPKFCFVELDGVSIAMHHEQDPVEALARSGLYQVVIYGHTHAIDLRVVGETQVINPGETGGWLTNRRTVVVLETETLEPELLDLEV